MLIIPFFIVVIVGFITCLTNALKNWSLQRNDWLMPAFNKRLCILKGFLWLGLVVTASGGLLQAIIESQA